MKKVAVFILVAVVTLCSLFAFTACVKIGETKGEGATAEESLVMNKRYISEEDVRKAENKQRYYLFSPDGTGKYVYHFDYISSISDYYNTHEHYVIYFKYTFADSEKSAVVCFYDRLERIDGDDGSYNDATSWSTLVNVSKNVLTTIGSSYYFWINEDYLETIPNFNK